MGDPAGIGPEVALKSVARESIRQICYPVIIGAKSFLERLAADLGLEVAFTPFDEENPEPQPGVVYICEPGNLSFSTHSSTRKPSSQGGVAAVECLHKAGSLCLFPVPRRVVWFC